MKAANPHATTAQLHGLLVVDKPGFAELNPPLTPSAALDSTLVLHETLPPRLPTSHDIVNRVRHWSDEKRIGHTGTLDPMASGVLVLTIGNATRLTQHHQGHDKRYIAEVRLGQMTDTYDRTGTIAATAAVPPLTPSLIDAALDCFRGKVMQVPPAFSAIKQAGKTAYQQARKGKEVTLEPRPVTFYQLDLLEFCPPDLVKLAIHCSTGTYIRSLAYDLGRALGTVAVLTFLRRTAVGPFTDKDAHSLAAIEQVAKAGNLAQWLLPTNYGLLLPIVRLDEEAVRRLGFGQQVKMPLDRFEPLAQGEETLPTQGLLAQALAPDGQLMGIIGCTVPIRDGQIVWRADKWFIDSQVSAGYAIIGD